MNKKLIYGWGDGFDFSTENGLFEVKAKKIKQFSKLSQARQYYDSLNEEKAIWDLTRIPELLECHTY